MKLLHGDCLIEGDKIESGSVDLILTDLPYGNMNTDGGRKLGINGWDMAIDPIKVYDIASRILRKNGKMILFSQEPYTTKLITEAIANVPFNYRAVWEKDNFANALGVNVNMVSFTEDILVFSKKEDTAWMHPLREYAIRILKWINKPKREILKELNKGQIRFFRTKQNEFAKPTKDTYSMIVDIFNIKMMDGFISYDDIDKIDKKYKNNYASTFNLWEGKKYKSNILKYKKDYNGYHPTQKPILLLEDLIKTFSNKDNLVVDLTMGSGSTGVACVNTSRRFLGIEQDDKYYQIACERIEKAKKDKAELLPLDKGDSI